MKYIIMPIDAPNDFILEIQNVYGYKIEAFTDTIKFEDWIKTFAFVVV